MVGQHSAATRQLPIAYRSCVMIMNGAGYSETSVRFRHTWRRHTAASSPHSHARRVPPTKVTAGCHCDPCIPEQAAFSSDISDLISRTFPVRISVETPIIVTGFIFHVFLSLPQAVMPRMLACRNVYAPMRLVWAGVLPSSFVGVTTHYGF